MEKKGAVLSAFAGFSAIAVLIWVFSKNASPYVSVAQARVTGGSGLHVAGQVEQGSLSPDLAHHQLRFTLKDDAGEALPIVYTGPPESSIGAASKVVAIGGMKDGRFYSYKLLVKCPSKYEAEKTGS